MSCSADESGGIYFLALQLPDDTKLILQAVKTEPNEARFEPVLQVLKDPEPLPTEWKEHSNPTQVNQCFRRLLFFRVCYYLWPGFET